MFFVIHGKNRFDYERKEKMNVRIICDSACDITQEQAKELGIMVLPLKILWAGEEYLDGVTMKTKEFFEKLIETDELPTTSQLSPYDYEQVFREVVEAGDTAVCFTISSKLSGTFQSANIANEDYEDKIIVVDTLNAALGQQIIVKRAIELRDSGKTAKEIADIINEEKKKVKVIALIDTLEYLKKGGRISQAAAMAGAVLNIKPVVAIVDGEIAVLGKARGSKNGNNKLMELVKKDGIDFTRPFLLTYAGLNDDLLQKYIQDSSSLYEGKIDTLPITPMGSVIGTHVGPGAIGVAFFAERV